MQVNTMTTTVLNMATFKLFKLKFIDFVFSKKKNFIVNFMNNFIKYVY